MTGRPPTSRGSAASLACPACGAAMRALDLPRKPHGRIDVDLCPACRGLWFDAHESPQLTPEGTLALLRAVAALGESAPAGAAGRLGCPRCRLRLVETQDVQRTTRFSYWRCPRGHGRFTPLVQFMREKDYLRPLTPQETERLRGHLGTVRCSACGAPADLGREPACRYCGARLEALDPDAVRRAIDARHAAAPGEKAHGAAMADRSPPQAAAGPGGADLIVRGLRALLAALDR